VAGALGAGGCAHTEGEYQARAREVAELKGLLAKAEAREGDTKRSAADQEQRFAQVERELRAAGLDPGAIGAGAEEQARALEAWRRRSEQRAAAEKRLASLEKKLGAVGAEGPKVTVRGGHIAVRLPDALFDAGRETLKREAKDRVTAIGRAIRAEPAFAARAFQIGCHLDAARPGGPFKDVYGLSAMRAREVLALLRLPVDKGGGGLEAARLSIAGFGDGDPLKGDDSPEGRATNRRCELIEIPAPEEGLDLTAPAQPKGK
jgi:flagellar motor protein MotB